MLTSAAFAAPPLVDATTGSAVPFARMSRPFSYVVGAPLFGIWDTLSLLAETQHYAVLGALAAVYALARVRAPAGTGSRVARAAGEALRAVAAFALLLGFYVAGLLLPRPMVGVELTDPELLAIDFHSHTLHSHDGWSLFTARRNRAWHEGAGFDVAYVTDHYTWEGFHDAAPDNPERVGERTALLSGAEIRIHRRPTNILGDRSRYLFALDEDSLYMEPDSLRAAAGRPGPPPTLLYTIPGALRFVVPYSVARPSGVIGIELSDGAPRGLEQVRSERAEILALADSADLAVVAGANLHGWGRTAAAWSVMRIPGWREMTPEEAGAAIESILHERRRSAVEVVERRMPYHGGSPVLAVLSGPWLAWEHLRMLGPGERLSWMAWLALAALVRGRRRPAVRG